MKRVLKLTITLAFCLTILIAVSVAASAAKWTGAWSSAMTSISLKDYGNISFTGKDITGRTVITPTASGSKIRLRFSNHYGDQDITLNHVTLAKSQKEDELTSAIDLDTKVTVTFGSKDHVTIKAGKEVVSDAVNFNVEALKNIAVSFYCRESTNIKTMGLSGAATYISTEGDKTAEENFSILNNFEELADYVSILQNIGLDKYFDLPLSYNLVSVVPLLCGVDVYADDSSYSICVIGDSTVANKFPQYLAEEIVGKYNTTNVGVLGKGVIGNTLATVSDASLGSMVYGESLMARFDRDCSNQSNVKYVIVKIGANDIMHPVCTSAAEGSKQPTANEIIANLQDVCDKAHAAGLKVILGTITQWKGSTRDYFKALGIEGTYQRTEEEFEADWNIAKKVNAWIMKADNTYHDGYFDFMTISKSSEDPAAFASGYSDDHIHPNDTLQRVWAEKFNMGLIGVSKKAGTIKLNASLKTLNVGKKFTLTATVLPSDVENKAVTWSSNNTDVATVSSDGKVTAVGNGTAYITCKAKDGSGTKAKCKITVVTPVESVTVTPASKTIYTRDTLELKATITPSNASDKKVKWSTSDKNVATVSSKGVVTAVKSGKVTITATTNDGSKKAVATIKVKKRIDVSVIVTNVSKRAMYVGKTYDIVADVYPTDASYPQVKWSSSDKTVATVDQTGKVTAKAVGTCTIKVKSVDNPTVSAKVTIQVYKHVSGVKLSPASLQVSVGYKKQLTPTISPSSAYNKKVTYSSSDKKVAKVSEDGLVKGIAPGTCVITVTTADGGYRASSVIKVIPVVKTTSVKLSATKKTIYVGSKETLKATVSPSNATEKGVVWMSSDTTVAKVSSKGVVTAVSKGTATITCATKDTGKYAECKITVKNVIPQKVTLSYPSYTLQKGKSVTLRATVSPSNSTNKSVKWVSSNKAIATVSSSGKVIAVKPGKCTITCTTVSGKKTATCKITVTAVKVTGIKLSATNLTLMKGKQTTLKATVSPSNATNKNVTWKSSNTKVATVSSTGVVKTVGSGKCTITCTAKDGSGKSATCTVWVP